VVGWTLKDWMEEPPVVEPVKMDSLSGVEVVSEGSIHMNSVVGWGRSASRSRGSSILTTDCTKKQQSECELPILQERGNFKCELSILHKSNGQGVNFLFCKKKAILNCNLKTIRSIFGMRFWSLESHRVENRKKW